MACWSTKAAISLKRVKIKEKELTNALSNGTILDPLRPSVPQDWAFANPTKNYNRYYLKKLRTSNLADTAPDDDDDDEFCWKIHDSLVVSVLN